MDSARSKGPVLLVDAGNALFKTVSANDAARASLILKAMGELKTDGMAVGARDLSMGAKFLKQNADAHHVPLLSANLLGPDKKLLFAPSRVLTVGGTKVGLIGISPMGNYPSEGLVGEAPVKAALAEAKKLRPKVDLVVVLAAVPFADSLQLSKEAGKDVDFIFQSHDARGVGSPLRGEGNYVVPTGERGRQVGSLNLKLQGKGTFADEAEAERQKQAAEMLKNQTAEVKKRLAAAKDPEAKRSLQEALAGFDKRLKEAEQASKSASSAGGRSFRLDFVNLGADVKEDADLKAQVEKVEPPGTSLGH